MSEEDYFESANNLRKRTKNVVAYDEVKPKKSDSGLYKFQQSFKKKFEVDFENECPDAESGSITCIVTGFTGTLDMLKQNETEEIKFEIVNGHLVLEYRETPLSEKLQAKSKKIRIIFLGGFILVSLMFLLFLILNLDKYYQMLSSLI